MFVFNEKLFFTLGDPVRKNNPSVELKQKKFDHPWSRLFFAQQREN